MKLKICIPFYKEYEACKKGLAEFSRMKGRPDHYIGTAKSYDPALGRNTLVSKSQKKWQVEFEGGFSHYLFIDSDISFRARDVMRLLAQDKDIISGAYVRKDNPEYYQGGFWAEDLPGNIKNYVRSESTGTHKVDYVGGGFLLVKAEALVRMEYPWFRRVMISNEETQAEVQEDYGFCLNARDHDLDVFLDCDVVVDHIFETEEKNSEDFTPDSISRDVLMITEALTKFSRKYALCYERLVNTTAQLAKLTNKQKEKK